MDRTHRQEVRLGDLQRWRATTRGRNLDALERARVEAVLPGLFGRSILQIGSWGEGESLIDAAPMPFRAVLGTAGASGESAITRLGALPLPKGVADVILLPHSLEFAQSPHRLLREADRVLTSRGHLLILGFNPLSWWGLRQRVGATSGLPAGARQLSRHRVCDWLHLLDFDVTDVHRFGVGLPWLRPIARSDGRRLRYWLSIAAESYLIVARKRTIPITPIQQRWRQARPAVAPALGGVRVSFEAAAARRRGEKS
ncbi:methyltransferase domain-containing protein [uncultured Abyssibacter sp.]|uniref:class I SAM-dependent methyltransferase n=1 Tax=uncultured Abyssibacter sp. TaxID=2320202 RepID=UPI0032B2F36D